MLKDFILKLVLISVHKSGFFNLDMLQNFCNCFAQCVEMLWLIDANLQLFCTAVQFNIKVNLVLNKSTSKTVPWLTSPVVLWLFLFFSKFCDTAVISQFFWVYLVNCILFSSRGNIIWARRTYSNRGSREGGAVEVCLHFSDFFFLKLAEIAVQSNT